jgi:V/A-type H+-transporting ATPase subunit I
MIVKMKKATLVTLKETIAQTLETIQDFGVLHMEKGNAISSNQDNAQERLSKLEKAITLLEDLPGDSKGSPSEDLDAIPGQVMDLLESQKELEEQKKTLNKVIADAGLWSGLSSADVTELEESGVPFHVFLCDMKTYQSQYSTRKDLIPYQYDKQFHLIQIGEWEEPITDLIEVFPPAISDLQAQKDLAQIETALDGKIQDLKELKGALPALQEMRLAALEILEFEKAQSSLVDYEELVTFTGYVPVGKTAALQALCQKEGIGLLLEDPTPDDPVPTLVENNSAIGTIRPVLDFLGTTPGYYEKDISLWFLIFFAMFFGIILGDAGYGALILLGTIGFHISLTAKGKSGGAGLALTYVLSISTVLWGAITGNWFASSATLEAFPILKSFVIPAIDATNDSTQQMVQAVCFWIAIVHLSIAQLWNFFDALKGPHKFKALAELGWMSMNVGLFNVVMSLVPKMVVFDMGVAVPMIVIGFIFVFVFSNQEGNFLKGIASSGANFITITLSGINAFSDLVSYIRLFAVGLASFKIAESFNNIAAGFGFDTFGGIAMTIFVLLLGHGLNLIMGLMSVLVHGVRLNLLEFSGRLGIEWSGMPYHPFKRWLLKETRTEEKI